MMSAMWIYFVMLGSPVSASAVRDAVDSCSKNEWTCLDGSCIALSIKCDGIADCPDSTDETPALCQNTVLQNGKCKLPEYPANGTYTTDISFAKPGDAYDSVTINITCGQGFGVDGSKSIRCSSGSWTDKIPKCIITHCYLPSHPSIEYRCHVFKPYASSRVCNEYEPMGTVVSPQCRTPVYYSETPLDDMRCNEGNWNYIAKCVPECGTVTPVGTALIINGVFAKRAQIPWHAGIYTKTKSPYMQICGGSLVKNNIVISAAHCFWSDTLGKLPPTDYAVAVGKLYRPWIDTRDEAQQSDVKELYLTDHFQGNAANFQDDIAVVIVTDPFEYTAHIRPVCIDFDFAFQESQLKTGHKGKVAGWGLAAENGGPSQVLQVIDLPYITTEQCISDSPAEFRSYITSDKICAGFKGAGKALCKGDSGGGLVFSGTNDKALERYYLRGVVSTTHNNDLNLCNANVYTTFTLLLKHEHFVKHWMSEGGAPLPSSHSGRALQVNRNVVRTFVDRAASPPAPFQHLTVDRNTGRVYIGALNRIHQLTADLERIQWVVTGPVKSSNECLVCPANYNMELKDNANKALVIDYVNSRLITCGSVFQGICSVRNLSNISKDVREVLEPVAANNVASSTVAFIAPGPPHPPTTHVLYVGTSYTDNSHFNYDVPSVSSRSLDDDRLFKIAGTKIIDTRMSVNSLEREHYPINYVYGFSSEGFSYFLTTQLKGIGSNIYYSKLVRVCHNDEYFYSYTEIPISCTGEGGGNYSYNLVQAAFVGKAGSTLAAELEISTQHDVLFAAFSQSETIHSNKPSIQSALCIYSLKSIRRTFTENIHKCFRGIGYTGLDFIRPSSKCFTIKLQIDEEFCGLDINWPLGGELPVKAVTAVVFDTRLTAVASTTTGDHTVVFAGTANGHLRKIVVENLSSAFEYGAIDVDEGSAINKDLIFDAQLTHLYVMTERRVSKVRVQECNEYKSCLECLGATDPYCGWRPLENECTLSQNSQNSTQESQLWLSYRSGRCPTVTQVIPNQLQRTTQITLRLFIENLPTYGGQFVCAFTAFGDTLVSNATRTSSGVSCDTPCTDTLPTVPNTQNHFTARLSVRTAQGSDVVATEFKFFDCNSYSSCTQCVTSPFPCDWCLDGNGNRCTHDVGEHCRNDSVLVMSVNRNNSYHSGPSFCPAFSSTDTNEILVPSGTKKSVKLEVIIAIIAACWWCCQNVSFSSM